MNVKILHAVIKHTINNMSWKKVFCTSLIVGLINVIIAIHINLLFNLKGKELLLYLILTYVIGFFICVSIFFISCCQIAYKNKWYKPYLNLLKKGER